MINKFRLNFLLLILVPFSCSEYISAQGFKGIIPLESTCEDVKRTLNVEKCTFPFSIYYLKDFTISLHFEKKPSESDKWCYKVPVGTITSFTVSYNKRLPIKDFEYELKFAEKLENDIGTIIYENSEKGVAVYVQNEVITDAMFGPTPEQNRKYLYECKSACK